MRFIALASCAVLAACGGSNPDGANDIDTNPNPPTNGTSGGTITGIEADTSITALASRIIEFDAATENLAVTDADPTGSAEYIGFASIASGSFDDEDEEDFSYIAVGTFTANIDFATDDLSAEANGFYELNIQEVNAFEDANEGNDDDVEVDLTDFSPTAINGGLTLSDDGETITGSLTAVNGETSAYNIAIEEIDFFGENGAFVDVFGAGTSSATGRDDLDVEFGALGERQ